MPCLPSANRRCIQRYPDRSLPTHLLTLPTSTFFLNQTSTHPKNLHHRLVQSSPSIIALVATRFRADLLLRLLNSLAHQTLPPTAVVICDNGPDSPTAEAIKKSPLPSEYLSPGKNLGFGGGLALAGQHALQKFPSLTHLLIVDDDAILAPTDLATLFSSMQKHSAGSIAPFLVDSEGKLQEVPEPTSWSLARAFRAIGQNLAS
ncbi:MAG: glycosyltransferase, partial [Verrucomicrobia bacterium]|nr:glycosyltransferase [Verrucomicrobiota bacterium]